MIIGGKFEGDDDTEIMWMQHEFYGKARGQIIQTCNRLTLFARTILKDRLHPEWGMIFACDHRTLQDALGHLAGDARPLAAVDCVSACNFAPLRRGIGVQF